MSRRDPLKPLLLRPLPEDAELHLAIAHHVGVWSDALLIAFEEILHHLLTIFLHEVHHAELDAELIGHGSRILDVLLPRAMANDVFLIDPVLHVGPDHVMPLADEQGGGDTAVHAS